MEFKVFGEAVARQFKKMSSSRLFRVDLNKTVLWDAYLNSFPEGSNPIRKERTEHDCQACKSFVRAVGAVVTIDQGELISIWDIHKIGGPYQVVADALSALVKIYPIENVFLHTEMTVGLANNRQLLEDNSVITWHHFFANLPRAAVYPGADIGTKLGEFRSTKDVMLRSLRELTTDSIDTVLDLIAQNSLYRGEEHKFAVESFRKLKIKFDKLTAGDQQDRFCWTESEGIPQAVSRIRNTAIGSLLVDLSEGKDLEDAVKAFETKVAPTNYRRPTALVSKAMIQKAQEKINELGFMSALDRRYATIDDITINNILFADRSAKQAMNIFEELTAGTPVNTKTLGKVEEVNIGDFITKILPGTQSLEVLFENQHANNLVSLIAPVDPTAKNMFKWPNNFSWSYTGEVTDSIKERVKKAGGSVTGDLCCRLAWDYTDDLDFWMDEPGGYKIWYLNKRQTSPNGGELDLDANGGDGIRPDPAENIVYTDRRLMRPGVYTLSVNNYCRRSDGRGFEVEIEFDGQTFHIVYDKAIQTGKTVVVGRIQYSKAEGFKITESLPSSQSSKNLWGLRTQTFQKVNVLMLSPNHWDERSVGNKHYFFMLEGCLNDGKARGFFNEFLTEELSAHRKVFEVVGAKMKTEESDRQLSGLGFSSTQRNSILCRVKGSFTRTIKINF